MRHTIRRLFAVCSALLILGTVQLAFAAPSLKVDNSPVDLAKQTKVKIAGTGFQAGQDVNLILYFPDGTKNDVGWALDPAPKADQSGKWKTTLDGKRYIQKKLIKAGDYKLEAMDADYNKLCSTTIQFTGKASKKKKKK